MSAPPDGVEPFERTEEGLMVWFADTEERALGKLLISSGWLNDFDWLFNDEEMAKLSPADRGHVEDVLDRLRAASGKPHPMESQPGDDW